MLLSDYFKKNKYIIGCILILVIGFIHSINTYLYVYDGHHHGFMLSNALDLLKGKLPYKEISIQYGIITTASHSIILKIFGPSILSINIFTIVIYYLSAIFIALVVKNNTNTLFAFLSILILIFNHPVPWLPWANYLAFFFLVLGIYFIQKDTNKFIYMSGLLFGLSCLARENFFIFISISILIFYLISFFYFRNKILYLKKISFLCVGFLTPIIIFLLYLYINNLIEAWSSYLVLPFIYAENVHGLSIFILIKNFILFFITDSFFDFITNPQYFLISIILISNTIFIIWEIFISKDNKKINLLIISILCIFSSIVAVNFELFRLYTSVVIGLISLLILIYKLKDQQIKNFSIISLVLVSFYSIIFYPYGNNVAFQNLEKINYVEVTDLKYFKHQKWEKHKYNALKSFNNFQNTIKNNCNIEYIANFNFDAFYLTLSGLKNIYIVPMIRSDSFKHDSDHDHLAIHNHWMKTLYDSKSFLKIVTDKLINKNIIILVEQNNYYIEGKKLDFASYGYLKKDIFLNIEGGSPKTLKFYYPKVCLD